MPMPLTVGTRPNAAINSNRWAGRTLSQQLHRKNWVPTELPEKRQDIRRISHYSRKDYTFGETSQDVLRGIANRLTNGPSPVGALPEPDLSELESEMAELSRRKSETSEGWRDFGADESDDGPTPIAKNPPDERTIWSLDETPHTDMENQHRQEFTQELSVDIEHERFEMQGSIPWEAEVKAEVGQAQWIDENVRYPGRRSSMAEVASGDVSRSEVPTGDVSRPELSSSDGGSLWSILELYDSSASPAELPGDPVREGELEGSIPALSNTASFPSFKRWSWNRNDPKPPSSQSPVRFSLANRVSRGQSQSRDSIPSAQITSPSPRAAGTSVSPLSAGRASRCISSNDTYSPLSNEDVIPPEKARTANRGDPIVFSAASLAIPEASRGGIWSRMTGKK